YSFEMLLLALRYTQIVLSKNSIGRTAKHRRDPLMRSYFVEGWPTMIHGINIPLYGKMSKHVLVVVRAKLCGGCQMFHRNWPSYAADIQKQECELVDIQVKSIGDAPPAGYPEDLARWIRWYPSI